MIELKHLCKTFAKPDGSPFTAVQDASLSIHAGEIFGLIGASGAGKSTLLRLINLLERPDSGEVVVDGQTLTALSGAALRRAQQSIGMIFQQFNLLANRRVAGNIAFPLEVAGWKPEAIRQRVQECLEIVGLEDRAAHYPAQLSGGQKQRVGIARALAPHPSVLLADEPTSALDPKTTRSILQFLKEINTRLNVTIVIVTHEMDVVRSICHRAAVIDQARILEVTEVANGQLNVHSEAARHLLEEI